MFKLLRRHGKPEKTNKPGLLPVGSRSSFNLDEAQRRSTDPVSLPVRRDQEISGPIEDVEVDEIDIEQLEALLSKPNIPQQLDSGWRPIETAENTENELNSEEVASELDEAISDCSWEEDAIDISLSQPDDLITIAAPEECAIVPEIVDESPIEIEFESPASIVMAVDYKHDAKQENIIAIEECDFNLETQSNVQIKNVQAIELEREPEPQVVVANNNTKDVSDVTRPFKSSDSSWRYEISKSLERQSNDELLLRSFGLSDERIKVIMQRVHVTQEKLSQAVSDLGFLDGEKQAMLFATKEGFQFVERESDIFLNKDVVEAFREEIVQNYESWLPWDIADISGNRLQITAEQLKKYIRYKGAIKDPRVRDLLKRMRPVVIVSDLNPYNAINTYFESIGFGEVIYCAASAENVETTYRRYFAKTAERFDEILDECIDAEVKGLAGHDEYAHLPKELLIAVLRHASACRANDIYFQVSGDGIGMIRLKVDGKVKFFRTVPTYLYDRLIQLIGSKAANGDTAKMQRELIDGSLEFEGMEKYPDIQKRYRFRLNIGPQKTRGLKNGIRSVIRLVDTQVPAADLDKLSFDEGTIRHLKRYTKLKNGLLFVTGPTGSGKSTTIYAWLNQIDAMEKSIQSIEKPVEQSNSLWIQHEVIDRTDLSGKKIIEGELWGDFLKGLLRASPCVILLGETRDEGTLKIVYEAAGTGHFVATTLHANTSTLALKRIQELGMNNDSISSLTSGILSQQFIARLCPYCRTHDDRPEVMDLFQRFNLHLKAHGIPDYTPYRANPEGCSRCDHGYKGRALIYEILDFDFEVSRLIAEGKSSYEIGVKYFRDRYEKDPGISGPMWMSALRWAAKGAVAWDDIKAEVKMEFIDAGI